MRRQSLLLGALFLVGASFAGCVTSDDGPNLIEMSGFAFKPKELHVDVGTTVTWKNLDASVHTVTAEDGSFDSGNMRRAETFKHTFDEAGVYEYYCEPHASKKGADYTGMVAKIIVGNATEPTAPPSGANEKNETDRPDQEAAAEDVYMNGFKFDPQELTIQAGTTVDWTNLDGVLHTVTADDGTFDSGSLARGESFAWTFDEPGTYRYHCEPHSSEQGGQYDGMTGTIVVEG